STYVFSPTTSLIPATSYRIDVDPALRDQFGSGLPAAYSWSFRTIQPAVVETIPLRGEEFADPNAPIRVTFNQPMDEQSVAAGLIVRPAGADTAIAGSFGFDGNTAIFTPAAPLQRGGRYQLIVPIGTRSASGGSFSEPSLTVFDVAPLPVLRTSDPVDGAAAAGRDSIRLIFSTPMEWGSVLRNLTIEPQPTSIYTSTYLNELSLYVNLTAEQEYRVTIGADARDPYGVALGQPRTLTFRTAPLEPNFTLLGAYRLGAYNAYAPTTRVPFQHVNLPDISYRLYRLNTASAALASISYDAWESLRGAPDDLVQQDSYALQGQRNQPQIDFLDFGRLAPGTYYLEIGAGGSGALPAIIDRQLLLVTQVALTMKRSSDELFFWAVDLQSGAPVRGLSLSATAYNYSLGGFDPPVSLGSTDADGVLRAAYTPNELYTTIYAWSNDPAQPVLISSDWGSGIGPWDFGLPGDLYKREVAGSIITDRPIYRPGHTVQLRGVLRLDDDGRYTLPAAADRTSVQVIDIDGNAIYSNTMTPSAFGSFNLSLPLAQGAPLGSYSVMAQLLRGGDPLGQPIYGSFIVSEYRRPVFEVTVTPATTDLLQGDALVATIASSYFAGGAPRNAPVRWRLLAQDLFFSAEAAPNFSVGRFDDADAWYRWDPPPFAGGELIGDGEGTTDAQGRFVL
ncbi:MAG TPA: Ig-like domain-containing protein, partial [Roseiflexaceae bacterium]|nr:Ig-like domain-containing protein [Roseiflexaceae bacterium]